MAQQSGLRVENMFYTLKELQNEKVCLEQKLQELGSKMKTLEQTLEQEANSCAHIQDKHRRMAGTFAVAQQKVDATMTACLSLQGDLGKKKPHLQKNQQDIETEKKIQRNNIKEFEASLSSLSKELFHARDFYKKPALQKEIENAKNAARELELKAVRDKTEIQHLVCKLETLVRQKHRVAASRQGCEGVLNVCYTALKRDIEEAEEYRDRVKAELKEIRDVLNAEQ